jgi:hypothetical protein
MFLFQLFIASPSPNLKDFGEETCQTSEFLLLLNLVFFNRVYREVYQTETIRRLTKRKESPMNRITKSNRGLFN